MSERDEAPRNDLEDTTTRPLPGVPDTTVTPTGTETAERAATATTVVQDPPVEAVEDGTPARRPVRMRGVVIGIVLLTVAIVANLRITTDLDLETGPVVLALMIGCGVLLIVGASRRE